VHFQRVGSAKANPLPLLAAPLCFLESDSVGRRGTVPSCRHSEVEEPRSSSTNLIVAMDRRDLRRWAVIVLVVLTMVALVVVLGLCSAVAAD